jgi:hypothetical protein
MLQTNNLSDEKVFERDRSTVLLEESQPLDLSA